MATFLRERLTFGAQAISLRLRLAAMLRRRSLPDLLGSLTPPERAGRPAPLPAVEQALAVTEGILGRIPAVPNTCLYRSLARYAVLREAGYPARFVMAVDPAEDDIAGHAWVELDGAPRGEAVDPGLVVTYSYPAQDTLPASAI
jgi:hypothetical protein